MRGKVVNQAYENRQLISNGKTPLSAALGNLELTSKKRPIGSDVSRVNADAVSVTSRIPLLPQHHFYMAILAEKKWGKYLPAAKRLVILGGGRFAQ